MDVERYYQSPSQALWQGRPDSPSGACFFQCIECLDLTRPFPAVSQPLVFVLLGFACDEGVRRNLGRAGAAEGPDVLRHVLARLPVHRQGIALYDAGNITCVDHDLEKAQQALAWAVHQISAKGAIPVLIGGGHEMAWGHYQGIVQNPSVGDLGILNFDAHFDMRPLLPDQKGSSGTPFLQIALAHEQANKHLDYNCVGIQPQGNTPLLFQTAEHYGVHLLQADEMHCTPAISKKFVSRVLQANSQVYVSVCLDVFSESCAPGVSAPQAFGLMPWQVIPLVRQAAASGKVIGYDVAELSPPHDRALQTARLAASLVYDMIHFHASPDES